MAPLIPAPQHVAKWHKNQVPLSFSSLTSINRGLCPMAAIPCSAFTSATSTLCSNCEQNLKKQNDTSAKNHNTKTQHNRGHWKLTLTLHTVCPCSLTCSQLEITCSIWVRSKKSSCSSSGMSWLKSMMSSTLSNFLRTDGIKRGQDESKRQNRSDVIVKETLKWQLEWITRCDQCWCCI